MGASAPISSLGYDMFQSLDHHLLNEVLTARAEQEFGHVPHVLPCPEYSLVIGMDVMMYDIYTHKVYKLLNFLKYRLDGKWCIIAQLEHQLSDFSLITTNVIWQRYLADDLGFDDEMCNNFRLFYEPKDVNHEPNPSQ